MSEDEDQLEDEDPLEDDIEDTKEALEDSRIDQLDQETDKYKIKEKLDDALKVVESVFDDTTRLILMKMINQGVFKKVEGAISTGKEANVYFAPAEPYAKAIKIFRIDIPSFKKMRPYIDGDHRFRRFKSSRSGFIEAWTKKEFKNLQRLREHDIPAPEPFKVDRNVLVMEYLGTETSVLPRLKEAEVPKPSSLYKRIMEDVKTMYRDAHLIHADLSEFNILFNSQSDQHFIIDLAQGVLWDHPRAEQFLLRDLNNMNRFFSYYDVDYIDLEKLYKWVTGEEASPAMVAEITGF